LRLQIVAFLFFILCILQLFSFFHNHELIFKIEKLFIISIGYICLYSGSNRGMNFAIFDL